jgi:hypothetical protein
VGAGVDLSMRDSMGCKVPGAAPTTVRLEMLALVNHRSTVIDLPVASYDNFVLIHWDEVSV